MPQFDQVLITCEHGGNVVPAAWRQLFHGHQTLLQSHRGWDPGALHLAKRFSTALHCPLHFATVTRLLIELNRSRHHRALFSSVTRELNRATKQHIIDAHYTPYRTAVTEAVETATRSRRRVLHLSSHSFTPVLNGVERRVDIGLLYDPARHIEREFCDAFAAEIRRRKPDLRVRRNNPYRGTADGFTTWLRRRLPASKYAGIELEVNQRFIGANGHFHIDVERVLVESLAAALE